MTLKIKNMIGEKLFLPGVLSALNKVGEGKDTDFTSEWTEAIGAAGGKGRGGYPSSQSSQEGVPSNLGKRD